MKHCLVVDDSRVVRKVARKILEELKFDVAEAEDGKIALDACRGAMPDVVLTEWNMPNMTGIDFLRALRREKGGDKPIVLFCTTQTAVPSIAQAIEAGANEYIMKPFDKDIIASKFSLAGLV